MSNENDRIKQRVFSRIRQLKDVDVTDPQNNEILAYDSSIDKYVLKSAGDLALGGLQDIVGDVTPQLGGDLDVNGQSIVSTGNGNIIIAPAGSGDIILGTLTLDGDQVVGAGQDDYVLTYDNATGKLSLEASAGGLVDIVSDTTPQLGGDLDVNGQSIVSVSNANITIAPNGTGDVVLGNFTIDADQTVGAGQDNYILTYDNATGKISLEVAPAGGLEEIVQDTTPQLGGNLDPNTFNVGDASAADLTKLSELTATSIELNYTDGVTSNIQTQLDGKAATSHPHVAADVTDFDTEVSNNVDVAANTTKLAGIEDGATADQTDAEIKIAYENNADTNAFTDAEKTKLGKLWGGDNNLTAIVAPTVNDDGANTSGNGTFTVGSVWVDTVTNETYRLADAATGAAVWVNTSLESGDLAAVAISGNSSDLNNDANFISNVVEDATPQLGGTLDLNGNLVGSASAADLTKLSQVTATSTELNYVDGVTSDIQTQINSKAAAVHTHVEADITDLGAYITASSTDTLTNKSIDATTNTLSNISSASFDDNTADSFGLINGLVIESPHVLATSDGATITFSVEKHGGGDIRVIFSTGVYTWDTTPADTVTLTAGTDASPVLNYVYFLESTKTLTASTTGWPLTEYAALATVLCQSAASLQTDKPLKLHAWSDHVANTSNEGHIVHINSWVRQQPATWISGAALTPTAGVATLDIATTLGKVLQLHEHTFPALNTATGSPIWIVNDPTTNYLRATDLTQTFVSQDINGTVLGGGSSDFYNLVIWGAASEHDDECKLYCNLPDGVYANNNAGVAAEDVDSTAIFTIPNDFKGAGFLIARLTVEGSGGTYSIINQQDLRGLTPLSASGGGGGSGGLTDIVDDASPQLGADLDVNGHSIISTAGSNINITPDTTGNVALGNFVFNVDQTVGAGQDNYVMKYDNVTGLVNLEAGGLENIVEDTSPQLGGNLDVNGKIIGSTTGTLSGTGNTIVGGATNIVNTGTQNSIVGGTTNEIKTGGTISSVIAGGKFNDITSVNAGNGIGCYNFIAGGYGNIISGSASNSAIIGSKNAEVSGDNSLIGGSYLNIGVMEASGAQSSIIGSYNIFSNMYASGDSSAIFATSGSFNPISASGTSSVIIGCTGNLQVSASNSSLISSSDSAITTGFQNAIIGGSGNEIKTGGAQSSVIAGGATNDITSTGDKHFIGGGTSNIISGTASESAIAGGNNNVASGARNFIGGGSSLNTGGFADVSMFGSTKTAGVGSALFAWVDNGIRIKPIVSDPSTLEDGTIWVTTGGDFKVRANGITKTMGTGGGLADIVDDTTPQLGANLDTNTFNIQFDDATGILDDSGNEQLLFQKTASAANYIKITNASTTNRPSIQSAGSDTNVGLDIFPKGTGGISIGDGAIGDGASSVAIGKSAQTTSTATNGIAIGSGAIATTTNTTAVGTSSNAGASTATTVGYQTKSTGSNTTEIGYWSSPTTRKCAVRFMGNAGRVATTMLNSATAPTDGGTTAGDEIGLEIPREMYTLQRNGNAVTLYVNVAGTVKSLSLGNLV